MDNTVREVFTDVVTNLAKRVKDKLPVEIRFFTSLFTLAFVVREEVFAPVLAAITSNYDIAVVFAILVLVRLDGTDRNMANQVDLFGVGAFLQVTLKRQDGCQRDLVVINKNNFSSP